MIKFEDYLINDFDTATGGNKATGVPITIYEAGTKTKASLYDENQGEIDNPVVTDNRGYYQFYIDSGFYDFVTDPNTDKENFLYQTKYIVGPYDGYIFKGRFVDGFTYELRNEVGIDSNGDAWIYAGDLPFAVPPGTTPSNPDYIKVSFSDHNGLTNRGAVGAHDDIYSRVVADLKGVSNAELLSSLNDGQELYLSSFWLGLNYGGGFLKWDTSLSKSSHNGGTVIDPDKVSELGLPSDADPFNDYFVADGVGNGCFVRVGESTSKKASLSHFGCVSDSGAVVDNSKAIKAAYDSVQGGSGSREVYWDGRYGFSQTIQMPASSFTQGSHADALGSTGLMPSAMIWLGGSEPMLSSENPRIRFTGFSIWNKSGNATDWIDLLPGCIFPHFDNINIALPGTSQRFSRSVIHSDGQRIGYGTMTRVNAGGSPAPKFIFLDGGVTPFSNRVTTFSISDCVIGASSGLEMTLFYIKNQGIETLNIWNNSFNNNSNDSNLLLVDTTDSPVDETIFNLNFENNEIDHLGNTATPKKFKLENVVSINFSNNEVSAGGQMDHLANLINSNVVRYEGNTIRSLANVVWDATDDCFIAAGVNHWGVSGTKRQSTNNIKAITGRVTQSDTSVLILDSSVMNSQGVNIREIDVNTASTFSIRMLVDEIDYGTPLTVVVRNVSGGAIANSSFFTTMFALSGTATAPSDGNQVAYNFYHDGVKFVEISRSNEVPTS